MLEFVHQHVTCSYCMKQRHHVTTTTIMRIKCKHRCHDYRQLKKSITSMDHRDMDSCIQKYTIHSEIMTSTFQET